MNISSYVVLAFLVIRFKRSDVFLVPVMSNTAFVFTRPNCFLKWHFLGHFGGATFSAFHLLVHLGFVFSLKQR